LQIDDLILFLHKMTGLNLFSRYLPVEPTLLDWGMYVLDAGYFDVPAGSEYPVGKHPEEYLFSWEKGRVLDEYQMVYLSRGQGVFECRGKKPVKVKAGDMMILRPGMWHRYKPDTEVGWAESWVGFQGEYAQRLMEKFFPSRSVVLHLGHDEELLRKMQYVLQLMREAPLGFRQMMAGEVVALLARVRSLVMRSSKMLGGSEEKLDKARYHLLAHATEEIDLEALAAELGLSYSRFRTLFRKHTGRSPRQYQLDIRMNRAMELLKESQRTVTEISEMLGFSAVYYFSRLFKQRVGKTPGQFRRG
jgi:AraC-like DNA-binding protein